jgi:hypothetical protein
MMPQYDAGPGDWTDRDWEAPDHKPAKQAKRRLALPPWVLLVAAAAIAVLVCVALVLIVKALRARGEVTPTAVVPTAAEGGPSPTYAVIVPTALITPTATATLPISVTVLPPALTEIAPGAQVVVQGTRGVGLNLRASPSTGARILDNVKDGVVLLVLEGPQEAGGYTWWKVRTAQGKEGWAAGQYLALKPQ